MPDWITALWIYTPAEFLLAFAIVFAGSFVRGFTGFGSGLVMVPLLTLMWGPAEALATMVGIGSFHSAQLAIPASRQANLRMVLPMMLAAVAITPLGTALHLSLDPAIVKKIIAAIVLTMTLITLRGWVYRGPTGVWPSMAAGGTTGLINGLAGVGGPAIVLYLMSQPGEARNHRANIVLAMGFTTLTVFVSMIVAGAVTQRVVTHIVVFLLPSIGFVWLGAWAFTKLRAKTFRKIVLWFLIAVSVAILLS